MKHLFYDLETTGFGPEKCAIIQLAGIVVDITVENKFKPLDAINLKMRPRAGKMIDQRSLEINGYQLDEILDWQSDIEAYEKFVKFIGKYIDKYDPLSKMTLCGYNNMHFDNDFLRQWFVECGDRFFGSYFFSNSIDVMSEASIYLMHYRPIITNFKLGNVARVLGIEADNDKLHDGMYDIKTTFKIFKKIFESNEKTLPFTDELAEKIFNDQQVVQKNTPKFKSKFTEENCWITVS